MWHAWDAREECTRLWWESPKERDRSEDQGVDGTKMDIRDIGWERVKWIQLAQDRDRWRALVNLRILGPRGYLLNYLDNLPSTVLS
jgi:alpha-glucosidase (family GH31 glycosyl hydrolase)